MFRAILLQSGMTLVAALAMGLYAGTRGAFSALLGGVACTLPNLLFALRLNAVARRPAASFPAQFLLGELFKVGATIGLLLLIVRAYADVHWPALLIGMGLALQAMFLAFAKK